MDKANEEGAIMNAGAKAKAKAKAVARAQRPRAKAVAKNAPGQGRPAVDPTSRVFEAAQYCGMAHGREHNY